MLIVQNGKQPVGIEDMAKDAEALGFKLSCDSETGCFLRTLAASCVNGRLRAGYGCGYIYKLDIGRNGP